MNTAELMAHDTLERLQWGVAYQAQEAHDSLANDFAAAHKAVDLRYVTALRDHAQRCDPSTRFLIASDLVRRHH